MKPNEKMINNQVILNQMNSDSITVKTEAHESSPASEALQLILSDSLDNKNLMFDLSKLLSEDQSLAAVPPTRISLNSNVQPMLIPRRSTTTSSNIIDNIEMEDTFSVATPSSSVGAFGNNSSYGASPQQVWEQQGYTMAVEVKQEADTGPGLAMSGGSISLSPGGGDYYHLQTAAAGAGPTLAQLNSPPNDELITLKTFGDLDSLNLDLEALTGDLLSQYPVEIKTEYVPVVNTGLPSFTWGRSSQLSTSVPTPVISHHSASTQSEFSQSELSNLSSGGPAVSPARLTLSPPASTMPTMIPSTVPVNPAAVSPTASSSTALHDLLMRKGPEVPDPIRSRSNSNQFKSAKRPIVNRQRNSLSLSNPLLVSQLSKSAPVKNQTLDMIWNRREPRPHMNSICSVTGDSSIADEVSDVLNSLSPSELNDIDSEDEDLTQEGEGDSEDDLRIDEEDLAELGGSGRKERFFWQYNVQAKGPKGQKLALDTRIHDPHELNDIIDPVFSDSVQVHGIKHSGKARRGDGNDLTANPAKLAKIGKELEKLGKDINSMTPVSEVPFPTRTKSRKEKNKLASRACRLKKKAQHEANKIKLCGLEDEHNELMNNLLQVKRIVQAKWNKSTGSDSNHSQEELTQEAEKILKKTQKNRVSGQTTEYVNLMIAKYS